MPEQCKHTGRVRPVVWKITPDGEEPAQVVCEQCWRSIPASEPAYTSYAEVDDGSGWYAPTEAAGVFGL